ncbi:MAG: pilus assembly protein PilM, partial [Oscillospiraceae bacterium]|nr:pilus assembly protein PilM [Oscillospiraceae bacterium]
RMLQFHRSRNTGEVIENIILYGDTHEYVRITDELEKLDLNTSLINVPPQIHGHENLEFSLYANAIGAMFKRNRETEKINLLETELSSAMKKAGGSGKVQDENAGLGLMLGLVVGAAVIVGGTWLGMSWYDNGIQKDMTDIQTYLDSTEVKNQLDHRDKLLSMRDTVNAYNTRMTNAHDAFFSQPVINGDKYETIQAVLDKTAEDLDLDECYISLPSYAAGTFNFTVEAAGSEDYVQKLPSMFIDNLLDEEFDENKGYYAAASYSGYTVTIQKEEIQVGEGEDAHTVKGDEIETVSFSVTVAINGRNSAYHPEEDKADTSNEEEAAA